ncbi:MAG: ABC transporter permease, partial [Anaerolineae bacterium]
MSALAARLQPTRRLITESPIAGPLITLVIVFVLFSLFVPNFLTVRSLSGIVNAATLTGTITIGITLLMISGEFDLSVGPIMAMGGFLYGLNSVEGGNPLWALFLALFIPGLMGALNGVIVNQTRIPSFITTLSTMFIYRGLTWVFSGGQMFQTIEQIPVYDIFNGRMSFIADAVKGANFRTAALWWFGLVLLFQYILVRTRFGNHVFASGGNVGAAGAQGVNVQRIKLVCFTLSGVLAG